MIHGDTRSLDYSSYGYVFLIGLEVCVRVWDEDFGSQLASHSSCCTYPRDPSIQITCALGPKVCKDGLHWALGTGWFGLTSNMLQQGGQSSASYSFCAD